jgi:nucleoside-diphosphate-sugar epimerase
MKSSVLILGARGRFGLAAVHAFAGAGWRVVGLIRPSARVPAGSADDSRIEWVSADLQDTASVARAAQGACVVVHALNPTYTHKAWKAQALPMTDAAISITRALNATMMFMGNIYNFGADMPALLTEDTPQRAKTVKGQIRIAMEDQIRRSGVPAIVIRAGDFFGNGTGAWFDQAMAKDIRKAKFTYPGHRDVATAWAYLPDLARTFAEVAARRDRLKRFEILHFAGHSVTGQQWLDAIEPIAQAEGWVQSGARVPYRQLWWPAIRIGALFVPTWAALLEMRYLWDTAHALDNRKLVALLGAEPHTPFAEAVTRTLKGLGFIKDAGSVRASLSPAS